MPCVDCYRGHDHHGPVDGVEIKLHGHDVYVAEPDTQTGAAAARRGLIVVLSDAFGWNTTNLRGLCDSYARRTGCKVYLPDFMYGTAAPPSTKSLIDRILGERGFWGLLVKPWLVLKAALVLVPFSFRNSPPKRYPAVRQWMDDLRCGEGADRKVGVVGFCWGGYGTTRLAHGETARNGKRLVDAAYTAHPSELEVPKDFEGIKLPYCMVIGDDDMAMSLEKVQQAAQILDAKKEVDSEVMIIPKAKHGFAVRASPDDKVEKEQADQAEDQMVKWFARYMD